MAAAHAIMPPSRFAGERMLARSANWQAAMLLPPLRQMKTGAD